MAKGKKSTGGVNKLEAVRQVISKHGQDTMPAEIVKLVKEEHGADMTLQTASTYKSTALKQLGLKGKRKGQKRRKPGRKRTVAAPRTNGTGISIEDIQAVKQLCARMGAEKVGELAQVLAK